MNRSNNEAKHKAAKHEELSHCRQGTARRADGAAKIASMMFVILVLALSEISAGLRGSACSITSEGGPLH